MLGSNERSVDLTHDLLRALGIGADNDSVRLEEVIDCCAFLEKLGIGHHVELDPSRLCDQLLDLVGGANGDRALGDDDCVSLHRLPNLSSCSEDVLQVGTPRFTLWRPYRDENHLRGSDGGCQIG